MTSVMTLSPQLTGWLPAGFAWVMPKSLMNDIRTGSIELEDQNIDLEELDQAYEQDLDQEEFKQDDQNEQPTI